MRSDFLLSKSLVIACTDDAVIDLFFLMPLKKINK